MDIDRKNDRYRETIHDAKGELVRDRDGRLQDHTGHGSDRHAHP